MKHNPSNFVIYCKSTRLLRYCVSWLGVEIGFWIILERVKLVDFMKMGWKHMTNCFLKMSGKRLFKSILQYPNIDEIKK